MAIAPGTSTPTSTNGEGGVEDFGANDWLLEEMYERFTADASSVDPSWAEYFATHGAPGAAASPSPTAGPVAVTAESASTELEASPAGISDSAKRLFCERWGLFCG